MQEDNVSPPGWTEMRNLAETRSVCALCPQLSKASGVGSEDLREFWLPCLLLFLPVSSPWYPDQDYLQGLSPRGKISGQIPRHVLYHK